MIGGGWESMKRAVKVDMNYSEKVIYSVLKETQVFEFGNKKVFIC